MVSSSGEAYLETTRSRPRILFLTKYSRAGASSRYRTFQFLPFLEEAGLECEVAPLFDDRYLATKYRDRRAHPVDLARALARRLLQLLRVRQFDLLVLEYELLPYFPAWIERLLARRGVRYVVDYDDALFHQYDQHRRGLVRSLLGDKIASVMRGARLVTVGNEYLADYAAHAGAKWVEQVPTVVDLRKYARRPADNAGGTVTIGWIGSPATAKYLDAVAGPLAQVCRSTGARVRLIGAGAATLPGVPVDLLAWDEATETLNIAEFDIGIMPLADGPWERGKCGFKLIQYMACGVPVVASPVGVNRRIVEPGVHGFLASSSQQWVQALTDLVQDASLRARMGAEGRRRVENFYSTQVVAPRLARLLLQAAGDSPEQVMKKCAESQAS
jgi:glycosyltransferase involved in cell wall biosynthesis